MILIDTSPLVSLGDRAQPEHKICAELFRKHSSELITTLPCLTESMYLLHRLAGWKGQRALWDLVVATPIAIFPVDSDEFLRMGQLMEKYKDLPMDFADASLVVAAERLGTNRAFTLDSDFTVYRINGKKKFEIIP